MVGERLGLPRIREYPRLKTLNVRGTTFIRFMCRRCGPICRCLFCSTLLSANITDSVTKSKSKRVNRPLGNQLFFGKKWSSFSAVSAVCRCRCRHRRHRHRLVEREDMAARSLAHSRAHGRDIGRRVTCGRADRKGYQWRRR